MKLDETIKKMSPDERAKVVELLRGKANMNRSLLTSDCEEALRKAIPKESEKVIKAMHMICDALTRPPKAGQLSMIYADRQDRYYAIAERLTEVITEEAEKKG